MVICKLRSVQDWLEKLSAHQIVLGLDENPTLLEVRIQKPRDATASRRNGQEWHKPFRLADDDLPVVLPELIVDSAASGKDSASRWDYSLPVSLLTFWNVCCLRFGKPCVLGLDFWGLVALP